MSDPAAEGAAAAARVTDPAARAAVLAETIAHHRDLYYTGAPELPDADFDRLESELRALLEEHPEVAPAENPLEVPGAPASLRGETVRHARPMLSLDKATTPEQVHAFADRFAGQPLRVTPKLDGVSLALVYEDGELVRAATRGTGEVGEVVTEKVGHVVADLPAKPFAAPGRVEVRGEAVMLRSVWAAYNEAHPDKPLVNPRNGAAGTLVQKDPVGAAAEGRVLSFRAFDAVRGEREEIALRDVEAWGFAIPPVVVVNDADAVLKAIEDVEAARTGNDFDTDGAVVRLDDPQAFVAAGTTSAAPRGAIAFKFPPEERTTKLLEITWAVGKIGRIPPRAQLEPVFVGGTTVTYASLHNPRLIAERDIRVGDQVIVRRAGDVIPFIAQSVPSARDGSEVVIVPPTHCPSCGTELVIRGTGEERWCENLQCPAQATRRLIHWSSRAASDMEGVGATWIEKLADDGTLERPSDFYALTAEGLMEYERIGEVSARNMVASIERSKGVGLRRALVGLAIPMASEGTAKRIVQAGFARIEDVMALSVEELEAIRDIGPKVAASIHTYFARAEVQAEIAALREHGVNLDVLDDDRPVALEDAAESPLRGAIVVVTGTIRHPSSGEKVARPAFVQLLERAGATNASSVSAATTALITGESVGASKTAKAEKLEVDVVDQEVAWGWLREAGLVS